MTNDHLRQRLPNRRFRRLLPAAVATVTLAASAPFAVPAMAQAADTAPRTPPKAAIAKPGKIPTLPRASTIRGERMQPNSAK